MGVRSNVTIVVAVAVFALIGCGGSDPEPGNGDSVAAEIADQMRSASAHPRGATGWDFEDFPFPDCEIIQRQIGGYLANLEFLGARDHPPNHPRDGFARSCTWSTTASKDMSGAGAGEMMEFIHAAGALTLGINVAQDPFTEEDAAATGYLFHDLRAQRVGGYVFAREDTDLNAPLGMAGIQVTVGNVTVSWGGGDWTSEPSETIRESFDKNWGIDAAVTVHRLIWD